MKFVKDRFNSYLDSVAPIGRQHRPQRKFLREIVYGALASQSVSLSRIARAIDEHRSIWHNASVNRLSEHLHNERLDLEALEEDYLTTVAPLLTNEDYPTPTIAVDTSDIQKPHTLGKKGTTGHEMPYIARVRDGDKKERRKKGKKPEAIIGNGYSLINIEAVGREGRRCPLVGRLYSTEHPEYLGPGAETKSAIALARPHVPDNAVWTFDRGFDGKGLFEMAEELDFNFVVRLQTGSRGRTLYVSGRDYLVDAVVERVSLDAHFALRKVGVKSQRRWKVRAGWVTTVRVTAYRKSGRAIGENIARDYSLVVARTLDKPPMVFLTNLRVESQLDAKRVVDAYFDRWGVEDAYRFLKQSFRLENHLRLRRWRSLRAMVTVVLLSYGFLAVLAHQERDNLFRSWKKMKSYGRFRQYVFYALMCGVPLMLRGAARKGLQPDEPEKELAA